MYYIVSLHVQLFIREKVFRDTEIVEEEEGIHVHVNLTEKLS